MREAMKNTATFVIAYVICMIPTYILPYFGSNSAIVGAVAASAHFINPLMLIHLAFMAGLIAIARFRGNAIDKQWLIVFPILATVFDFVPFLSWIPLVPTVMHLLAIILGVISVKESSPSQAA